jgi:hypothetical protein
MKALSQAHLDLLAEFCAKDQLRGFVLAEDLPVSAKCSDTPIFFESRRIETGEIVASLIAEVRKARAEAWVDVGSSGRPANGAWVLTWYDGWGFTVARYDTAHGTWRDASDKPIPVAAWKPISAPELK